MAFLLSPNLESAASVLAGTLSEKQRQAALEAIAREGTTDAARLLMDLFHLTAWGPHRRGIVRTLGHFTDGRTCEFLYRLAVADPDLTIGREAVLALGRVGGAQAQEILLALVHRESYPFRRDAVYALRSARVLTVADELLEMFGELKARSGSLDAAESALLDTILLVLAAHGTSGIEADLVTMMTEACHNQDAHLTHACLLAAGALGSDTVRESVRSLDVDDRSVTAALKETILKIMDARPRQSIEDVVTDLLRALRSRRSHGEAEGDVAASLSLAIYRLAEFSLDDLGLAAGLLQDEVAPVAALWLRSVPFLAAGRSWSADDSPVLADLLQDALAAGDEFLVSLLAKKTRSCLFRRQQEARSLRKRGWRWRDVLDRLAWADSCALAVLAPDPELLEIISSSIEESNKRRPLSDEMVIKGINGLVAQAHMTSDEPSPARCLGVIGRLAWDTSRSVPVRGRAIRALGQIAFVQRVSDTQHAGVTESLAQMLRQSGMRSALFPSIIHALGHLPSERSLEILIGYLQVQADALAAPAVLEPMLLVLTNFPRQLLQGRRLRLAPDQLADPGIARLCLRLLGLGIGLDIETAEACRWLVKEALVSRDFSDVVLGLDAVHNLVVERDWDLVLELVSHEHEAIRSLALERLCRSRRSAIQNRLVEFLRSGSGLGPDLMLHCFDVFEVDAQDPPLEFARFLVDVFKGHGDGVTGVKPASANATEGPLCRPDVRLEGLGLAEQILLLEGGGASAPAQAADHGGDPSVATDAGQQPTVLTDLDRIEVSLRRDLPHFDRYSETLKTVLRNAELPFSHPEIFKESVDKSTAIIEFVKSIDLLLQERIGEPLFLGSRPEVLARLQSRVARLGLHDLSGDNARAMRLLGIDHIFTPELFPSIKLSRLVQSIMAGRFVTEQLRILDGLKGWAIFLVLFARSYVVGGTESEALLRISGQHDDRVTRLAWEMILLQERRNIAAHRGTILDGGEILGLRQQSIFVLGTIDALCPPLQRGRGSRAQGHEVTGRSTQGAPRLRNPA